MRPGIHSQHHILQHLRLPPEALPMRHLSSAVHIPKEHLLLLHRHRIPVLLAVQRNYYRRI
jgi:hypothetical protein